MIPKPSLLLDEQNKFFLPSFTCLQTSDHLVGSLMYLFWFLSSLWNWGIKTTYSIPYPSCGLTSIEWSGIITPHDLFRTIFFLMQMNILLTVLAGRAFFGLTCINILLFTRTPRLFSAAFSTRYGHLPGLWIILKGTGLGHHMEYCISRCQNTFW